MQDTGRQSLDVLGIDLAKLTFDATLLTTTGTQFYASFPNTVEGFTQLQAWLLQHDVTALHACLGACQRGAAALARAGAASGRPAANAAAAAESAAGHDGRGGARLAPEPADGHHDRTGGGGRPHQGASEHPGEPAYQPDPADQHCRDWGGHRR